MVRNLSVFASRCRVESDAVPGGGDQVEDALRAEIAAICRNERPLACGRASGAPERRGTNAQEDLRSDPDIVRRDDCGAEICGFLIRTQDKSGIYDVPGLREYAACFAVCVCNADPDSGRERLAGTDGSPQSRAGADKLETS